MVGPRPQLPRPATVHERRPDRRAAGRAARHLAIERLPDHQKEAAAAAKKVHRPQLKPTASTDYEDRAASGAASLKGAS